MAVVRYKTSMATKLICVEQISLTREPDKSIWKALVELKGKLYLNAKEIISQVEEIKDFCSVFSFYSNIFTWI